MNLLKAGFIFMASFSVIGSTTTYESVYPATDVPVIEQPTTLPVTPKEIIRSVSDSTGISYDVMYNVIECESGFNPNAIGDNGHSFGLVQIFLEYHPTVTKEQALNPEFAINFLAEKLSQGKGNLWTCYRTIYGKT